LWQGQTPFDDLIPQQQDDAAGPDQDDASTDDSSLASSAGTSGDAYDPNVSNSDPALLYKPVAGKGILPDPSKPENKMIIKPPNEVPPDAVHYIRGDDDEFYAPPHADFKVVYKTGVNDGLANYKAANKAIAQGSAFDYQRDIVNKIFHSCYTDASNYAVGVYMQGAGYSKSEMLIIGLWYALNNSKNAGSLHQIHWWFKGWNDAKNGKLATKIN
jgi:hypothetical protein